MLVIDRYIDNRREVEQELALLELEREMKALDNKATYYNEQTHISNSVTLVGAQ